MICSEIVNFDRTVTGLTSKRGRILPAVELYYQNQSNSYVGQCTMSRDVTQKFVTQAGDTHILTHRDQRTKWII